MGPWGSTPLLNSPSGFSPELGPFHYVTLFHEVCFSIVTCSIVAVQWSQEGTWVSCNGLVNMFPWKRDRTIQLQWKRGCFLLVPPQGYRMRTPGWLRQFSWKSACEEKTRRLVWNGHQPKTQLFELSIGKSFARVRLWKKTLCVIVVSFSETVIVPVLNPLPGNC
jgi:hypothetical protein